MRSRMRARGQDIPPLPMLVVVIDEFYEWFRIMPTAVDVLDSIGRQGRAYWIHLMMASQTIESRAEKLMENMGYRLVLKARTAGAAQAAGVPNAVNLPAQAGLGYFRKSLDEIVRFQAEFLWRDYRRGRLARRRRAGDADPFRRLHSAATVYHRRSPPSRSASRGRMTSTRSPTATAATARLSAAYGADAAEEEEEEEAIRTPKVGTVIIDQLRRIDFQPYRLWQPPLDRPVADRGAGQPFPRSAVAGAVRHIAGPGVPGRDHRPAVQARPAAVDGGHLRARLQRADPGRRWVGQDHRAADADHLGCADPHARAGPVLRAGVQQHRADDGGRVAARRRGRRSDRPVRRSPHGGRTACAAPRTQAHLPRVRRAVDGGLPAAQVRR